MRIRVAVFDGKGASVKAKAYDPWGNRIMQLYVPSFLWPTLRGLLEGAAGEHVFTVDDLRGAQEPRAR